MISGILLAAGNSRRMGEQNKLLLPVQGEILFEKMVKTMEQARLDELIVVLGHDYKLMIPHCNSSRIKLAINGNHLEGQTTSIKAGMHLINPSTDAVMICLADMPLLTSDHLNEMIEQYEAGRIMRPMNDERPGNPSIFPKSLFDDIFECQEKEGCKSVIDSNKDLLQVFETSEAPYFSDIDTPEQYAKFKS